MLLNKTNNRCLISIIFLILVLFFGSFTVNGSDNIPEAEKYYKNGMDAFNGRRWGLAVENFRISYNLFQHSTIAYMISCTYIQLEEPGSAEDYANLALTVGPPLEEPYRTDAMTILRWAKDAKTDNYYLLIGKADDLGIIRPNSPTTQPPQASVPQYRRLVQQPVVHAELQPMVVQEMNLTGKWRCKEGGDYFLHQVGDKLWWYGQSPDGGRSWANVFHGTIRDKNVIGSWADVPRGKILNSGEMTITIVNNGKLRAIRKTGGFGGNEWTR